MDDMVSYNDLLQQYHKNIVRYRGRLVFVTRVFEERQIRFIDLLTGVESTVPFSLDAFAPTKARLGMINIFDSVIYSARMPVRKYGMGLNLGNTQLSVLPIKYPLGQNETFRAVQNLGCVEIGNTLSNNYPTFEQAIQKVTSEHGTSVAFDRQFALTYEGTVFYKTTRVGSFPVGITSPKGIVWRDDWKHLSLLLENNYENTVTTPCP